MSLVAITVVSVLSIMATVGQVDTVLTSETITSDFTPMSVIQMEGYQPSLEQQDAINPFSFHFWTRGFPEIIPFGEGLTHRAHGSNIGVFYYEEGLRTGWYRVEPGERVRDDPRERPAPFPSSVALSLRLGVERSDGNDLCGKIAPQVALSN